MLGWLFPRPNPITAEEFFRADSPFALKRMDQLCRDFHDVNGVAFDPNDPHHAKTMTYAITRYKLMAVSSIINKETEHEREDR